MRDLNQVLFKMEKIAKEPKKLNKTRTLTWIGQVLLLAILYHLAARVGLSAAFIQINTSPVWPPTGIAIAALLILGQSRWPGVSLGVLLGSILTGAPLSLALGMSIGNTLEAVAAAYVLGRLNLQFSLNRIRDVIALIVTAFFATMISATIGAATLLATNAAPATTFGSIWLTWWIGDLLGALVIAPLLLTWLSQPFPGFQRSRIIEATVAFSLLLIATSYAFLIQTSPRIFHQALIYLIFPFVIWTAIRFGQRGGTVSIVLTSSISIWATVNGLGPFSLNSSNENLILLQTFLGVLSITSLILASATTERRQATAALRKRASDLTTLNETSRVFLEAGANPPITQTICNLATTRLGVQAAWITLQGNRRNSSNGAGRAGISIDEIRKLDLEPIIEHHNLEPETIHTFSLGSNDTSNSNGVASHLFLAIAPLILNDVRIGDLFLTSAHQDFFSEDRLLLLHSFANLSAMALQNRWLFEEVRYSNRQLHALSQRLIEAQEAERLHLSRELHDESGQLLTALIFDLGLLERGLQDKENAVKRIRSVKDTATTLQNNLHQIAVDLRPASLDHLGLQAAVRQLVLDFSEKYSIQADFEVVGMSDGRLPRETETTLYRVVQEALTNVALHARASLVDVLIGKRRGSIVATIEDNGVGFVPGSYLDDEQLGLFGMRERIEMLGGQFTLESSPGKGTTVNVEIPIND